MWEYLPSVALWAVFRYLDAASLVLAADVYQEWYSCINTEGVWKSFIYDCDYVDSIIKNDHSNYDWDEFYCSLFEFFAKFGIFMHTAILRNVSSLDDVQVLEQLAERTKNLLHLDISVSNSLLRGATLRQLQNSLYDACSFNGKLKSLSIKNTNLTREPCSNRSHIYSIFNSGQARNLEVLTVTTPSADDCEENCPPHIPVMSMGSIKNLKQLQVLRTSPHDVDVSAARCLSQYRLHEVVLLCRTEKEAHAALASSHIRTLQTVLKVTIQLGADQQ